MQLSFSAIVILLTFGVNPATADKHHDLLCVKAMPDNNSVELNDATRCACDFLKSHEKCSDCTIMENRFCHSDGRNLDGDDFEDACVRKCLDFGATGSSIPPH
ncbi:uncharacterized protein PgNI_00060 [Pyricularia grisea]|uniref:Extracellular membrane protein CFEM domain-containing protein n=1 Tax=Pyricularia grisea TaxID=148305 RepID=A0A6P8BKX4_PYRGI|nr:uncharacterized protein PgNI_00060 [Pyricularia grisea]TLD17247.1 hypothetical protein PgNI_00060 [Pyricularia grisea]